MRVRFEINRGDSWQERASGDVSATLDEIRSNLRAYATSYPHRVLVGGEGGRLIVCAPQDNGLTVRQSRECHVYAGVNAADIEFLS